LDGLDGWMDGWMDGLDGWMEYTGLARQGRERKAQHKAQSVSGDNSANRANDTSLAQQQQQLLLRASNMSAKHECNSKSSAITPLKPSAITRT
jgi:hypothetical protein